MDPHASRIGLREDHRTYHASVTHTVGDVFSANSLSGLWTFKDRKTGDIFELDFEGMQNIEFCLEILEATAVVEVIPAEENWYFEKVGSHRLADGEITLFRDPVDAKNFNLVFENKAFNRTFRLLRRKEAKRRNAYNAKLTKKMERDERECSDADARSAD